MRRWKLVFFGVMLLLFPATVFADNRNAKIELDIAFDVPHTSSIGRAPLIPRHSSSLLCKNPCIFAWRSCEYTRTAGGLYPPFVYYTYLVVRDYDIVDGIGGMECGIAYTGGVTIFGWAPCVPVQFPTDTWPASGTGIRVLWDPASTDPRWTCQAGTPDRPAVAGFFYMGAYSPGGVMEVIRSPMSGRVTVADCAGVEQEVCSPPTYAAFCTGVSHLGSAAFNAEQTGGYSPCGMVTPVHSTTWGAVKALYRR